MRLLVILLMSLVLLFGCVGPQNNPYPNVTTSNVTVPVHESSANLLSMGDIASVNYVLRVNDTVFDTNIASVANSSGIYNPQNPYAPMHYQMSTSSGLIPGFINGTLGMAVNETRTFQVSPDQGYGPYNLSKLVAVPRYYNKSLYEVVPLSFLLANNISTVPGRGFRSATGMVFVNSTNTENATLFYLLIPGEEITVVGIPQRVVSQVNNMATLEFDLNLSGHYVLPDPVTGVMTLFKILNKTNDRIILDSNHPYAGKTLTFTVTLLKIQKPGTLPN